MICLSLTRDTASEDLRDVRRNLAWIDLVELRVDRFSRTLPEVISRFPAELPLRGRGQGRPPCILTIRRKEDGGDFSGSETERRELLEVGIRSGEYDYLDLELDLEEDEEGRRLRDLAEGEGCTIIRSAHDPEGVSADPAELYRALSRRASEIPKLAVTPRSSAELDRILELMAAERHSGRRHVILGMGPVGVPTRVAAPMLGGYISYASAEVGTEVAAAPGHMTPRMLAETYRYREQSADTALFGVVGNPVMHSASPAFHNRQFTEKNLDAVYVPFQVDDLEPFFRSVGRLSVRGLSVTVPHKEGVIDYLDESDESVVPVGACNTVLITDGRKRGVNTDIPGFMLPLERAIGASGPEAFDGMRATVIGAGGAARAVVFALLRVGVRLCVVNRTRARADRMVTEIADALGVAKPAVAELDPAAAGLIEEHGTLIVQTTPLGMSPREDVDPLPFYEFRGHEIAYDLIYAPERTRFLARADEAGCLTISGTRMFEEQALAQAALFEHIL
ncbi:MAG: type I 3-dehydroquinate dehydratase [Spirochaetota bacterium]